MGYFSDCHQDPDNPYAHRLHYRWSQLEADRWGNNVGSPICPLPIPDRVLHLGCGFEGWPTRCESIEEKTRFKGCSCLYKTIDYNTFAKNGVLKLTEIELFFLNRHMTRNTCSEWCVVYLGVGNGERFRCLRDEFFPSMTAVVFDPCDDGYTGRKEDIEDFANKWCADGTNFEFYVRCFDDDKDPSWILEKHKGKKFLVISDIRGVALDDKGEFDKHNDNDVQWRAIQNLRPIESIVKFSVPGLSAPGVERQFYEYVPGVLLKQTFTYYTTMETRLLITGVPASTHKYDVWELYEKMSYHQEHLRGQVYETTRPLTCPKALDHCFDCTILWKTLSEYAQKNDADPCALLGNIIKWHVYTPSSDGPRRRFEEFRWEPPSRFQRWRDVEWYLTNGALMEAVSALEVETPPDVAAPEEGSGAEQSTNGERPAKKLKINGYNDPHDWYDWHDIAKGIERHQPSIAERLRQAPRPVTRAALIQIIGSFSEPFTLVKTQYNGLASEYNGRA